MGNPAALERLRNAAHVLVEIARQAEPTATLRAVSRLDCGAEVRIGTDSGSVAAVVYQLRLRVPLVRVEAREDLLHSGKEAVVTLSDHDEWTVAAEHAQSWKTLRLLRFSALAALFFGVSIQLLATVPTLRPLRAHFERIVSNTPEHTALLEQLGSALFSRR